MAILRDLWSVRRVLIVILTPVLLIPLPLHYNIKEAKCAYVVLIVAVFWITEALPIAVTSLLPVILFPLVGMMSARNVSASYVNDTSLMFLGGMIVAAAIEQWNIHKRIALRILLIVGPQPHWLMLGLMLPAWFLSMWNSNVAITVMMLPIANAVLLQLKDAQCLDQDDLTDEQDSGPLYVDENQQNIKYRLETISGNVTDCESVGINNNRKLQEDHLHLCKAFSLAIAYAANIGGSASLTGTGSNFVMKAQSDTVFEKYGGQSPVTFATYMLFCLPMSIVMLVILWVWLQIYFLRCRSCMSFIRRKNDGTSGFVVNAIRSDYDKLGPITFGQIAVLCHFVALALAWLTRNIGGVGGWSDLFPESTVTDSTPAILIASSMFLFPSQLPRIFCCNKGTETREVKPLLSWDAVQNKIPWGVFLLLGGGFALAKGSEVSGLSALVGKQLSALNTFEPWVMNLLLCLIMSLATEVTSNMAICTLMMPILSELALHSEINPVYILMPTSIAASFAFMLPVATPSNAVVFAYGYIKISDMIAAGFVLNMMGILVLTGASELWGDSVFDFHTFPAIFHQNVSTVTMSTATPCLCTNWTQ